MTSGTASTAFPELKTTVLPSNGQLLAEETVELVEASLAAMRASLAECPAWSGAPSPTDDFLLMFLRAEVFNPELAAARYHKFWQVKVGLCGEDRAALPIKAEDACMGLQLNFIQIITGSKDVEGRQVILVNAGNANRSLDDKLRVLAVWYVLLAALEDVETQRRGVCFLTSLKTVKFSQIDPKCNKVMMETIQGALPVRIGSINYCYPPSFFRMAWMMLSPFLHKRIKKRVRVIPGTDTEVGNTLGCIVKPENLPPPMGSKVVDLSGWLAERVRAEA